MLCVICSQSLRYRQIAELVSKVKISVTSVISYVISDYRTQYCSGGIGHGNIIDTAENQLMMRYNQVQSILLLQFFRLCCAIQRYDTAGYYFSVISAQKSVIVILKGF